MVLESGEVSVLATAAIIALMVCLFRVVKWTRARSPDTRLWGTVFESLTHYIQPQEPLKEPRQEIRKQKRNADEDDKGTNGQCPD